MITLAPGVLLVLDGWGHAAPGPANALTAAHTPVLDALTAGPGGRLLDASGTAVGLPEGTVGNSETGHLVMGAGRAVEYDSLRVEREVRSGGLRSHPVLSTVCGELASSGGTLHLVGLCSDGGIHSDIGHLPEILRGVWNSGLYRIRIWAITDGRDVADGTAGHYLSRVEDMIDDQGVGSISGVVGRDYAMDKSGKDHLTAAAVRLLLDGQAERTVSIAEDAVLSTGTDGAIPPTAVTGVSGRSARVEDGDCVLFTNFRSDRTAPLADMVADKLAASGRRRVRLISLAQYDTRTEIPALVPRADASGGLSDVLVSAGARSLRVAEPEKFEHVTFFFNGRDARARDGEEYLKVTGAPDGPVHEHPEMNAPGVAGAVAEACGRDDIDLVLANLANMDVVGHTGNFDATRRAAEAVDAAVAHITSAARAAGRWTLIVGDHGNAEEMLRSFGDLEAEAVPYGGHTLNPVHCVLVPAGSWEDTPVSTVPAAITSVAPTVLRLFGLPVPRAMTAPPLLGELTLATAARDSARSVREGGCR
ncbi:2,3-bisphosphoglycerate-independent phosphoglycerate mutase [Nocardiopsis sp. CNT312]|uniref:2,3-bisphosphoglycerate-independent phosphoglycerate mutase n=1 Tax=Nocardiopsis sp. CNT312 TaxID=1137268 RepID=UPI0004B7FC55|nr:2,3-bisphosphoglycerate-independent phosphoglycerate mutase [Nocardiopsis sp. CNT312]